MIRLASNIITRFMPAKYTEVITVREKRGWVKKKKMADMFLNSTRGIKMPPLRIFTFCSLLARFPFPFFEAETRG